MAGKRSGGAKACRLLGLERHPDIDRRRELARGGLADIDALGGHLLSGLERETRPRLRHALELHLLDDLSGRAVHDRGVDRHRAPVAARLCSCPARPRGILQSSRRNPAPSRAMGDLERRGPARNGCSPPFSPPAKAVSSRTLRCKKAAPRHPPLALRPCRCAPGLDRRSLPPRGPGMVPPYEGEGICLQSASSAARWTRASPGSCALCRSAPRSKSGRTPASPATCSPTTASGPMASRSARAGSGAARRRASSMCR